MRFAVLLGVNNHTISEFTREHDGVTSVESRRKVDSEGV